MLILLACVTLAGLVAARNFERRRELAVGVALGLGAGALISFWSRWRPIKCT